MLEVAIDSGEFAVVEERNDEAYRWRLVRVTAADANGVVTAYAHPADYEVAAAAVPRVRTAPLYQVGVEHTAAMVRATQGLTADELTYDTPRAARDAVLAMIDAGRGNKR